MAGISDAAHNGGDFASRLNKLEDTIRDLQRARRLESATIGRGGLRLVGGNITVDEGGNIVIRNGRFVAGNEEGAHTEITSEGFRAINQDGEIDIDLTTATGVNRILLRGNTPDDTGVLLTANGEINGDVLNVNEIFLDGQSLKELLEGNDITDPTPTGGTTTNYYNAEWSQAYRSNGQPNNFVNGGGLTQGRYSGTNGNQKSLIGFDTSQIQSDMTGRTITRVRVRLRYYHWFNNSGGTAILGHHGHSSEPGSFSATATDVVRSFGWPKPGTRWVTYSHSLQQWATGTKTGIVLGPGPTSSRHYYGIARGHNQSSPPRLEIKSEPT